MIPKQIIQSFRGWVSQRIRYWKLLSVRKLFYLPHILTAREKKLMALLLAVVILSGGTFLARLYWAVTKPAPQIGNSYTEGLLKEPRTINPLFAVQDTDRDISRLVFSGLFSYSGQGALIPDLAEKFDISADGKIYTVSLRKNALWHDHKPVTADDVAFTIRTIQNPRYKSVLRANWQGVLVERLDNYTIRFTLRTPYAPFVENLTTGILPQHLWEDISPEQALLHELNLKPVGSGPYVFDRLRQEKDGSVTYYRLSRNTSYFREGPYLKKIIFLFFKDEGSLLSAWKKGLIDGFGPVATEQLSELNVNLFSVHALQMPRIFGLFFNEKRSADLANKKIRQAIAYAIDRKEFSGKKAVLEEVAPAYANLPFIPIMPGVAHSPAYIFDPETARKILKNDGWEDSNHDGILDKKTLQKGKVAFIPLRFTLITSDWPDLIRTAETIKTMLRAVGIDLIIEKKPFADLETAVLKPRNFEMLLFGQVYGYEPDPFTFWHSSQSKDPGLNIALYANKKADKILEEVRRTSDAAVRLKKYEEFSDIISEDLPAIFLYSQLYLYVLPSDIRGVNIEKISLPSDRFNEINKWYRETKRVLR